MGFRILQVHGIRKPENTLRVCLDYEVTNCVTIMKTERTNESNVDKEIYRAKVEGNIVKERP